MSKIKLVLATLSGAIGILLIALTTSVLAGGWGMGVTGNQAFFKTTGTETLKTNSTITIRNAPIIMPRLLPRPPTMKAAQMRKVVRTGFMKSGHTFVFSHAQSAPASAAIPAPSARLAAL